MEKYKDWPVFDAMPEGWAIDKTAGSPLGGCVFVTNGKSVLNGQKRGLLRIKKSFPLVEKTPTQSKAEQPEPQASQVIDQNYRHTVNELARKKFQEKLLKDIQVDLVICELEGWDKLEYLEELKTLINGLGVKCGTQMSF